MDNKAGLTRHLVLRLRLAASGGRPSLVVPSSSFLIRPPALYANAACFETLPFGLLSWYADALQSRRLFRPFSTNAGAIRRLRYVGACSGSFYTSLPGKRRLKEFQVEMQPSLRCAQPEAQGRAASATHQTAGG